MRELIEKLETKNIKLWVDLDGNLHYKSPKGALSQERAVEIKENKGRIIDYLRKEVCEKIVHVAEKNEKVKFADAKWEEGGYTLRVEPERIRKEYEIYDFESLRSKIAAAWKNEVSKMDEDLLRQWITVAEKVALNEMWAVMCEQGFFQQEETVYRVEKMEQKLGVIDKYKRFFERWLTIFEKEGFIRKKEGGFVKSEIPYNETLEENWEQLWAVEEKLHYGTGFVKYLEKCSKNLKELFRGEVTPLELLFPNGETTTAVDTYQKTRSSQILNHVAEAAVLEACKENAQKTFRILEVGAGVGGTSDGIIRNIKDYNVEYYYTDVSMYFLNKAKERYQGKNWIKYKIFDINQGGLEGEKFDLIVCANVLHNARNGIEVLRKLKSLMNDEGIFVILDAIKEPYYLLTSIEFNDGLRDFEDFRKEDGSTFFEQDQWIRMFEMTGMDRIASYPKREEAFFGLGQGIFVLGGQNHPVSVKKEAMEAYLKEALKDYEVPKDIKLVSCLDGKNRTIIKRQKDLSDGKKKEKPVTKLEMELADIWMETLGQKKVGRHDNFFALGGDSLLLSQIIAKAWERIPETKKWSWGDLMREILETPTIAGLAKKIEAKEEKEDREIITLIDGKEKDQEIYVLFHAGTGSLYPYVDMVNTLRVSQFEHKVLGISCTNPQQYLAIPEKKLYEDLGKKYANLLKKYGTCKLTLLGHCVGGILAIETAKQLLKEGIVVNDIVMISTNLYKGSEEKRMESLRLFQSDIILEKIFGRLIGADVLKCGYTADDRVLAEAMQTIGNFTEEAMEKQDGKYKEVGEMYRNLLRYSHEERIKKLFSSSDSKRTEGVEDGELMFQVFKHNLRGAIQYNPSPYDGKVKIFACDSQTENFFVNTVEGFSEKREAWGENLKGKVESDRVQGDHISCMESPYIEKNLDLFLQEGKE